MPKITITCGLPASGKSTWAREEIANSKGGTVGITKDDLRLMFSDTKKREKLVLETRDTLTKLYLDQGLNVIWHDTNLNPIHEIKAKEIAKEFKSQVVIKDFTDVSVSECIKRDLKRLNSVGEKVIRDMYNQYLAPKPEVIEYNLELPNCYIFDIDGSLAIKSPERGYFEWDKVGLDLPNTNVVDIHNVICNQANTQVFFFSGRDRICETDTYLWLSNNLNSEFFDGNDLFMRPQSNTEDDTIIKKRMYEENIKGKYNVLGVFDDRPKVNRMWRSLGLPVFAIGDQSIEF